MDLLSTLARLFLHYRVRAIKRYAKEGDAIQRRTLKMLVHEARNTQWGREHGYVEIRSYEDFAQRVPIGNYSSHKPYITRMMEGTPDVLWKGRITHYATSSGTTSDVVKFIPVSKHGLSHSHLRGGRDVTATYLDQNRGSHVGSGYSMILSGGFNPKYTTGKIKVGDISAIMAAAAPSFYRKLLHLVPPLRVAQMEDIHAKYDVITDIIRRKNLVAFSGQPTWNIMVLEMAMQKAGVKSAEELWPNMELFAHGGMSLVPYRHKLEALFPSGKMHYIENYNASEGFFGVQTNMADPSMTLMLDYANFYEFVPMNVYGKPEQYAVPVWKTEIGVDYAILVSTSSGLWRYDMGDVVRFTGREPYRFVIVGRTHQNINLWGEDLSVQQAEKAMETACKKSGAKVKEFTVAPVFLQDRTSSGYHQWLVEFTEEPADIEAFADTLDAELQKDDIDYEHFRHRTGGGRLQLIKARPGLFYDWLDSKGKLGGQHKIPRLSSTRKYIEELIKLNI